MTSTRECRAYSPATGRTKDAFADLGAVLAALDVQASVAAARGNSDYVLGAQLCSCGEHYHRSNGANVKRFPWRVIVSATTPAGRTAIIWHDHREDRAAFAGAVAEYVDTVTADHRAAWRIIAG